jgi:predicted nucleic acid-binding protein
MTRRFVLDAWAVLALLQKEEPAAARVHELFEAAQAGDAALIISLINLGEIIYRVGKVKGERAAWETLAEIQQLPIEIISVEEKLVWSAVTWKMHHAISYADAFAAATAEQLNAILLTGDPELIRLSNQIQLEPLTRRR